MRPTSSFYPQSNFCFILISDFGAEGFWEKSVALILQKFNSWYFVQSDLKSFKFKLGISIEC